MSVAFVTNFCPHYRVRTFELLARRLDAEMLFFSRGSEAYWPGHLDVRRGDFPHRYLRGFSLAGARITPGLPWRLLTGRHDAVVKCVNGRFALPAAYLAARLRRRPFVLWTGVWHRLGTPAHRLFHPLTRHVYRHADAVVVYGEHVRGFLVGEGVEPERIFVAPHATDRAVYGRPVDEEERRETRRRLGVPEGRPVILYLGRLEAAKGVHDLLAAFLALGATEALLLYVGDGAERAALEAAIARAGAGDRVRLLPPVAPEGVPPVHAIASVLVLPSVTTPTFKEPWGLVVNEAFYQGVPVIATDAVGAAAGGLVEDGVTGRVVPEGDRPALSAALAELIGQPALRRRLGRAARERMERWSDEAMVQGFVDAVEAARRRRR